MIVKTLVKANSLQRKKTSHILLYHTTYSKIPGNLCGEIHNVDPEVFYKQLKWLTTYFDVIDIDEYFQTRNKTGKAVITFDDGYKSFSSEGFPILKSLKIPCTVFLCGCTIEKKIFWRDKIRFLINNNLVAEFLKFNSKLPNCDKFLNESNFYQRTKSPFVNSFELDRILDMFMVKKQVLLKTVRFCAEKESELVDDSLVTYGNHTYDHYVLSSLSEKQQEEQIGKNYEFLRSTGRRISKVFSVPFGGQDHLNQITYDLLKKYGYIGFLYSRGRINTSNKGNVGADSSLRSFERYMPAGNFGSFQKQLLKMAFKGLAREYIFSTK